MKIRILFTIILALLLHTAYAQSPCNTSGCSAATLNISTGYDQTTGTYKTPVSIESNWKLVAVPSNASITLPAPCYVIAPHPAWSTFTNAKWVSPFQSANYNINNPIGLYGPFQFQNCFCICQQTSVHIKFDLMADDKAFAFVDGIPVGSFAGSGNQFVYGNRVVVDTFMTLSAGTHCITVNLHNTNSVAMGFSVEGSVTGASLLSAGCCNPAGRICGAKLLDANCDGVVNPATDLGLQGWTITLKNSSGVTVATAVTDAQGNYCFDNVTPGTYTVSETNQTGWNQSYPSGSGVHTVNVVSAGLVQANFGNCGTASICGFKLQDMNCDGSVTEGVDPGLAGWTITASNSSGSVVVTAVTDANGKYCINNLPPGTYYVYETNQPNWVQTYPTSGVYVLNLTAGGSATATFGNCYQPPHEDPCNKEIAFDWKTVNCGVKFESNVDLGSAQIVMTEWTFGDEHSSFEPNPWHFYENPGTYKVCLKVTYFDGEKCCTREVCKEVKAEACEGGCRIEPKIDVKPNDKDCKFTFSGDIVSTSTPVTSWFWDFGDGTTGTGSVIDHKFPCTGSFKVCLVVFGATKEGGECCYARTCTEVKVDCDPCVRARGGNNGKAAIQSSDMHTVTLSDKNAVVLNQNVPNPFAESTTITYSIPHKYSKAQIMFSTATGTVVKTVEVTGNRGSLTVYADDLSSGVYTYTLVVDGKPADTKKMVRR